MSRAGASFEEPVNAFRRSLAPSWAIAIISTIGGVTLITGIPFFLPDTTANFRGFELVLFATLFVIADTMLWAGILGRQRYRLGDDWAQPARRPLAYALRGQNYVVDASQITEVRVRRSENRRQLTTAFLTSGGAVRLTPPLHTSDANAALNGFLNDNAVRIVELPSVQSHAALEGPSKSFKVTALALAMAWLVLSGVSVYFALWGGVPLPYAFLFILSSWAVITLWLRTIRRLNRRSGLP